jgi:hypothetical protein
MSTMEHATATASEAATPEATAATTQDAVEEQMGKILTELGSSLGVLLISLGTRSGLWAALAGRPGHHGGRRHEGQRRPRARA